MKKKKELDNGFSKFVDGLVKHLHEPIDEKKYETIDLDMSDEEFLFVSKEAHKRDITFNKMIEFFITDFVEKIGKMPKKEAKKLLNDLKNE